jgi:hypothetical protein
MKLGTLLSVNPLKDERGEKVEEKKTQNTE